MSMAPKDGDIIKDSIAVLLRGIIGTTGDTGGSQTAGSVFAKENEMLRLLHLSLAKGNMILKKTASKSVTNNQAAGQSYKSLEFSFDKPVRFVGFAMQSAMASSSSSTGISKGLHLINGEDSFSVDMAVKNNTFLFLQALDNANALTFSPKSTNGSSMTTDVLIPDVWVTKVVLQIGTSAVYGSTFSGYVIYQEEG